MKNFKLTDVNFASILARRGSMLLVLSLGVAAYLSIISPAFRQPSNLLSLTQFAVVIGLLGLGQLLAMTVGDGGLDLSVGGMLSLASVTMGFMVKSGVPLSVAIVLTVVCGFLLGAINGVTIAYFGVPALVATLASMLIFASLALGLTGGASFSGFPQSFAWLGQGTTFGLPNQFLFVLVPVLIVVLGILRFTAAGRRVYEVGINEKASKLIGTNPTLVRFSAYAFSGALAGVGAVVVNSWFMTAKPDIGDSYLMLAMTVAILGGVSVFGGIAPLGGFVSALVLVTLIQSGLLLANVSSTMTKGLLGAILVVAALLNVFVERATDRGAISAAKKRRKNVANATLS